MCVCMCVCELWPLEWLRNSVTPVAMSTSGSCSLKQPITKKNQGILGEMLNPAVLQEAISRV